jgi:hypothetical protein
MTRSGRNDDAWDNICLNPHHKAHDEGRESGRSDGAIAGYEEGFRLGQTMALSYGIEVGFVRGVLSLLQSDLQLMVTDEDKLERIKKSLLSLQAVLDDFPTPDDVLISATPQVREEKTTPDASLPIDYKGKKVQRSNKIDETLDISNKMQRICARFKLLTVQLHVPSLSLKNVFDNTTNVSTLPCDQTSKTLVKELEETSEW